ncbi:ATP-binding protein [Kibdelosporangium phytohabitans]|uniref:Histidine kinase/HSP90-like ATPase domain-containing protein n=1 Tax=Kibdelosporangium phytohabitans TaxID=860235 RepID=A0A0N9HVY8_9PSEU|nr:ATP-binding protein [Kibdelosporangium phytohabitans]ALG09347.1 hypothetical protein AOZ06_22715 [Kibdelosporangium phytohabitans]MBE1469388.1 signal transduction histidine kinase [Kibdelosporangium phytohabitans]
MTRSLVERMTRAGGSAVITSSPGAGTTVRMTCPRRHARPDGDEAKVIGTSSQRVRAGESW